MSPTYDELRILNDAYTKKQPTADRTRTARRQALLDAGIHPATRAPLLDGDGETCGDCSHSLRVGHNSRSYWKCDLVGITRGAGTDIRKGWPACELFNDGTDE